MKVLVADDDEVLLEYLRCVAERWGHEVVAAVDGKEAWDLFQTHADIVLVITDWLMPGMDGPELVGRIRNCRRPGYVYIILLTAKSRTEDVVRGMKAGADDFLAKPFDQDELQVRLRAGERVVELEQKLARRNAELEAANERMHRDLEAAALVQQSLLPTAVPETPRARFAWVFKPCEEMSGDSLGIVPLDERHTGIYLLDVSGHGVAAALLSVSVTHFMAPVFSSSSLLRRPVTASATWCIVPPADVAAELNRRFPVDAETGRYFTFLYGILDHELLEFRYVSAGHPAPVHLPVDGAPIILPATGLPIGLKEGVVYQTQVVRMRSGDRLFLNSDGLLEATSSQKEMFGRERFLAAVQEGRQLGLQGVLDLLLMRLTTWCEKMQLRDDVSLVAVEVK